MAGHCRMAVGSLNKALEQLSLQVEFLRADLNDPASILETICLWLTPEAEATAREEFAVLPRSFLPLVVLQWRTADEAGIPFELISEKPELPITHARNGRVTYRIESDAQGVRFYVQHIHGRHAEWMKSPELVAV